MFGSKLTGFSSTLLNTKILHKEEESQSIMLPLPCFIVSIELWRAICLQGIPFGIRGQKFRFGLIELWRIILGISGKFSTDLDVSLGGKMFCLSFPLLSLYVWKILKIFVAFSQAFFVFEQLPLFLRSSLTSFSLFSHLSFKKCWSHLIFQQLLIFGVGIFVSHCAWLSSL